MREKKRRIKEDIMAGLLGVNLVFLIIYILIVQIIQTLQHVITDATRKPLGYTVTVPSQMA